MKLKWFNWISADDFCTHPLSRDSVRRMPPTSWYIDELPYHTFQESGSLPCWVLLPSVVVWFTSVRERNNSMYGIKVFSLVYEKFLLLSLAFSWMWKMRKILKLMSVLIVEMTRANSWREKRQTRNYRAIEEICKNPRDTAVFDAPRDHLFEKNINK